MKNHTGSTVFLLAMLAIFIIPASFPMTQQGTSAEAEASSLMPPMKGMTLNAWSAEAYNSSDFDESVTNLAEVEANWVLFTVFWFMETKYSTTMQPRLDLYTASDSSLIHAVQKAHQLSLKVALKPMVDVVDGTWRGQISPSSWSLWFDNYRNFINHYAELAEAENVELFVVGTELKSSQSLEAYWRQSIDSVRTRFSGKITYAANWDSYSTSWVKYWDALDYVGVDAYFPLTNTFNPTLQELINAWSYSTATGFTGRNWVSELYSAHMQTGKKIVFTEIGYCSQDGTNTQPWNWNISPTVDQQEQADCYQAALEKFKTQEWFEGWFWWNWETDPDAGGPTDKHYTPQNKQAQNILYQYYYELTPDIAVIAITCSKNIIGKGYFLWVNATIENQGTDTETFNVTLYANATEIETRIVTLENGSSTIMTFLWDTETFDYGRYALNVHAWPLPQETDTSDNTSTALSVTLTLLGDINGDFKTQLADLVLLARAYGSKPGDANWNPAADIDNNNGVGLSDLVILAQNYWLQLP